jgi:mercuric ion binding protein
VKRFAIAALSMLTLAVAAPSFAKETTTTVKVKGWHCAGCAGETEEALKEVKGVKKATADFDKKQVVVAYDDSKAKPSQIEAAITKAGYTVEK